MGAIKSGGRGLELPENANKIRPGSAGILPAKGGGDSESAEKFEVGGGQDARAPGEALIVHHF